ncbi:MAG: alpha/beta hydrolase [Acidobacteriota bacterium]
MKRALPILLLLGLAPAATAQRGPILDRVPEHPDRAARYVIYLHGRIVEEKGPRPTHEQWGVYEYRKILEALAPAGMVISEQRPAGTDMDRFAQHVAGQVRTLVAAGVPADHITVIGFSKGGGIAIRTSALLRNDKVHFVFLAACGDGDFRGSDLDVRGRILSVYEASDEIGRSCAQLFAKSKSPGERKEVRISIGGGHGAFFRPRQEWTSPVLAWVER